MPQDQSTNVVDPRMIMQAIMSRMAQQRGNQTALTPAGMPQMTGPGGQPQPQAQPPQGGVPGAAGPPGTGTGLGPIQQRPRSQLPQGHGVAGMVLGLVNAHQQKEHDKKATLAEGYYNQISDLLATDPNTPEGKKAHEQAQHYMDDPKIRKMLYEGLNWKPLEEEPPPEAQGVQAGIQKQAAKQQKKQPPWAPQGRAILPPPSQAAQQATALGAQKTATSAAEAEKYTSESEKAKAEAKLAQKKTELESQVVHAELEARKAQADAAAKTLEEARQKIKEADSPVHKSQLQADVDYKKAQANELNARAKYWEKNKGKVPTSAVQSQLKSARGDMVAHFREAISDNNKIKDEMRKQSGMSKKTGGYFGFSPDPSVGSFEAEQKVKKMSQALSWYDSEGVQNVTNGTMSVSDAVKEFYKQAGIDVGMADMGTGDTEGTEGGSSIDDEIMRAIDQ